MASLPFRQGIKGAASGGHVLSNRFGISINPMWHICQWLNRNNKVIFWPKVVSHIAHINKSQWGRVIQTYTDRFQTRFCPWLSTSRHRSGTHYDSSISEWLIPLTGAHTLLRTFATDKNMIHGVKRMASTWNVNRSLRIAPPSNHLLASILTCHPVTSAQPHRALKLLSSPMYVFTCSVFLRHSDCTPASLFCHRNFCQLASHGVLSHRFIDLLFE